MTLLYQHYLGEKDQDGLDKDGCYSSFKSDTNLRQNQADVSGLIWTGLLCGFYPCSLESCWQSALTAALTLLAELALAGASKALRHTRQLHKQEQMEMNPIIPDVSVRISP